MSKLSLFVPITKVDAVKGIVYGTLAAEETDRAGEVFDYEGSKPFFEKWSGDISKATNGASLGNLRAMHGAVAAGKFTDMQFDDATKRINVAAKVVDKNELEKVLEGVYTGFSIGGKYVSRKKDGDVTRYIADPYEGSLVDLPCIPSATFDVVKADGATLQKAFKPAGEIEAKARELCKAAAGGIAIGSTSIEKHVEKNWRDFEADAIEALAKVADEAPTEPTNDEVAEEARKLAKAGGKPDGWLGFVEQAREALKAKGKAKPKAKADAAAEDDDKDTGGDADAEKWTQVWTHPDLPGKTFAKKAELRAALTKARAEKTAAAVAAPVTAALADLTKSLTRSEAVASAVARVYEERAEQIYKLGGISEADADATDDFIRDNPQHEAVKALGSGEVRCNKDGTEVIEVPEATKTLILAAVAAAKDDIAKREFTDEQRKKMAKEGTAMSDGSFPIASKADLKNAIQAYGRAKNKAAAKRHIIRRAKALGATSMLPEDWHVKLAGAVDLKKFSTDGQKLELKKAASLYTVANLVQLLAAVDCAEEDLEAPSYGYRTVVPKDLCDRFGALLVQLGDLVAEILDECLQDMREEEAEEASGLVERMTLVADLTKAIADIPLMKAKVRDGRTDLERLGDVHDLLVEAGVECDGADDDADKTAEGDLRKTLAAEREAFAKTLNDVTTTLKDVAERVKRIEQTPLPEGTTHATKLSVFNRDGTIADPNPAEGDANKQAFASIMGEMGRLAIATAQQNPVNGTPGIR